jgi:CheY-like chemotaxis protein
MENDTTTFLLVEDDPNDVALFRMEFARGSANLRLQVVQDGAEAMDYLNGVGEFTERSEFPFPDVILLDLKMPRVGGFEFLEWLRSDSPDNFRLIPVVIMSSSALKEDVDRAYALGANSYLVKPVGWADFKERVRALGVYWAWHAQTPDSHPH